MYVSLSLLNDISRNVHNIDFTGDMSRDEYFWILKIFQIFMVFVGFIFFYFLFVLSYVQRICESNPSLLIFFLKSLERFWCETLHPKSWKNELESFTRESLCKDIRQLKLCPHEVEFHYPFLHLFSDEVMTDVNMLGSGMLDIVAAQSNGTFVITIHRDFVEVKPII